MNAWKMVSIAVVLGAPMVALPGSCALAAEPDRPLTVQLDSIESLQVYYEDVGLVLDREATAARRQELERECFMKGSRRFGNEPRPIHFVGLFYDPAEPGQPRYTICMCIRPCEDAFAERICALADRPLVENRMAELRLICGPKAHPVGERTPAPPQPVFHTEGCWFWCELGCPTTPE